MPVPSGRTFHVPLDIATTPASGRCIVGAWWCVHPEKGVAFYRVRDHISPQCNDNEAIARHLVARLHPDHEARRVPVVYMSHARAALEGDDE